MQKIIWLMLVLGCMEARAQSQEYIPPMPKDFSKTDFYLQTVGTGSSIYMGFGHTLIRIIDRSAGSDMVYNWGIFDFESEGFFRKFIVGKIFYRMDQYPQNANIALYRREKRKVLQEKLNLSDKQKEILMKRIIWQSQPENRYFMYVYHEQNCSTKVRDYLDEALGGQFSGRMNVEMSSESVRQAIKRHFDDFPISYFGTDILINSDADIRMNAWQEMFLPANLRKHLLKFPQIDDQGKAILGSTILSDSQVLLDYPEPEAYPFHGYQLIFFALLVPLIISPALLRKPEHRRHGERLFAATMLIWGVISTFFGVFMTFNHFFSYYTQTYHNANLWLFWPVDVLWIVMAIKIFKQRPLHKKFWTTFLLLHVLGAIVLKFGRGFDFIAQDVSNQIFYMIPIMLGVSLECWNFFLREKVVAKK